MKNTALTYVDCCVVAVPSANKDRYITHAKRAAEIFKDYGALELVECWGDDIVDGEKTSFPLAVQCREDETVVLSWITWPSKDVRNQAWSKIKTDKRMCGSEMPFDGSRLIYGGFQTILSNT